MSVIYRITCVENGKFYIGSTVNKTQRWARHRRDLRLQRHKNRNMQASWDKYGEAAFVFEVIEEVGDPLQLMAVEQRWLDACVGQAGCFNHNRFADAPMRGLRGPGTSMYGKKHTPEALAKLRAASSGSNNANWGKPLPPERREKIRASNLAYPHAERRHTPEAIAKIAAASRGRPVSLETRAKRSKALQGHEVSSVTRAKISASLSGEGNFWYGKTRPDHGAKVSKPIIAIDPEGAQTTYASITELRAALDLNPPTVNRALKSGQPLAKGPKKGWRFQYAVP